MLRIQSTRLGKQLQPICRQSLFAIRHESTASNSSTAPTSEPVKKTTNEGSRTNLSQRLSGSGRGKLMESSGQEKDVFASFLAQAQKKQQQRPRNNNRQRRPEEGQREAKPGQFDDAAEGASTGVKRSDNRQQQQQQQQQRKPKQQASGENNKRQGGQRQGGQQRDRRPRQDMKKSTSYGSTSTSGPTRRATTFIDKDIDWASLSPVESVIQEASDVSESGDGAISKEQKEQLEKELNTGDYTRFLSMGETIQWPGMLNTRGLESLVGSNASYGLDEKMTFLATVAKASSVGGAAAVKK